MSLPTVGEDIVFGLSVRHLRFFRSFIWTDIVTTLSGMAWAIGIKLTWNIH